MPPRRTQKEPQIIAQLDHDIRQYQEISVTIVSLFSSLNIMYFIAKIKYKYFMTQTNKEREANGLSHKLKNLVLIF